MGAGNALQSGPSIASSAIIRPAPETNLGLSRRCLNVPCAGSERSEVECPLLAEGLFWAWLEKGFAARNRIPEPGAGSSQKPRTRKLPPEPELPKFPKAT